MPPRAPALAAAEPTRPRSGPRAKSRGRPAETELYAPVKAFLEARGYAVKSEIGGADVVACREGAETVIVELKTAFSLQLFHQGVARLGLTPAVYLAVPKVSGRAFRDNVALARRLGLGVLTVRLHDGLVEPVCDPGPFRPRSATARRTALLNEFARRTGDPNSGGRRGSIVTAYRQDCERIARHLHIHGPSGGAAIARAENIPTATRMLADNHYGWFTRIARGLYGLTESGRAETVAD